MDFGHYSPSVIVSTVSGSCAILFITFMPYMKHNMIDWELTACITTLCMVSLICNVSSLNYTV